MVVGGVLKGLDCQAGMYEQVIQLWMNVNPHFSQLDQQMNQICEHPQCNGKARGQSSELPVISSNKKPDKSPVGRYTDECRYTNW